MLGRMTGVRWTREPVEALRGGQGGKMHQISVVRRVERAYPGKNYAIPVEKAGLRVGFVWVVAEERFEAVLVDPVVQHAVAVSPCPCRWEDDFAQNLLIRVASDRACPIHGRA